MAVHEGQLLENISCDRMSDEVFEECEFSKCNFLNAHITACNFIDCTFVDCNFSLTNLSQSTLNNVEFKNCKVLGVKFNYCHDFIFEVGFQNCILDYSSFEKRKMIKTCFKGTSLKGVNFDSANLKQSEFIDCDLNEAIFHNTNIQEADFTTAFNYIIALSQNQTKKARFSKDGLAGLLHQFNIIIE